MSFSRRFLNKLMDGALMFSWDKLFYLLIDTPSTMLELTGEGVSPSPHCGPQSRHCSCSWHPRGGQFLSLALQVHTCRWQVAQRLRGNIHFIIITLSPNIVVLLKQYEPGALHCQIQIDKIKSNAFWKKGAQNRLGNYCEKKAPKRILHPHTKHLENFLKGAVPLPRPHSHWGQDTSSLDLPLIMISVCLSVDCCITLQNTVRKHYKFEMKIPERDVTYIVLSVYLLTLVHRYSLNRKQSY